MNNPTKSVRLSYDLCLEGIRCWDATLYQRLDLQQQAAKYIRDVACSAGSSHDIPQFLCTAFDRGVGKMVAFLGKDLRRGGNLHTFAGACVIPLGNCNRNYPS